MTSEQNPEVCDATDDAISTAAGHKKINMQKTDFLVIGSGIAGLTFALKALDSLLTAASRALEPGAFILLTAHTPGYDGDRLAAGLARALGRPPGAFDRGELALSTDDERRLDLGAYARWPGGGA